MVILSLTVSRRLLSFCLPVGRATIACTLNNYGFFGQIYSILEIFAHRFSVMGHGLAPVPSDGVRDQYPYYMYECMQVNQDPPISCFEIGRSGSANSILKSVDPDRAISKL